MNVNESIQYYENDESKMDYNQQYSDSQPQEFSDNDIVFDNMLKAIGATVVNTNITNAVNLKVAGNNLNNSGVSSVAETAVQTKYQNTFNNLYNSFQQQSQKDKTLISALFVAIIAWFLISKK